MINKLIKLPLFVMFTLALLMYASCNNTEEEKIEEDLNNKNFTEDPVVIDSGSSMGGIIENLSSPVEMAALIKSNGVPFSLKYLSNPDNIDKYNTQFKQAIGLGILGADLGYLNIYSKTSYVVRYITAISKLSEALSVSQFFDFETLQRLATNNENLDSLVYISTSSFNKMDKYLRDKNRSDQGILIITGVWIEAMYLATQVVAEKPNKQIIERIGEQKLILDELLNILKKYESKKAFSELISDLERINEIYKDVTIEYEVGEPETVEVEGRLMIIQNETSVVTISDEQIKQVIDIVKEIRSKRTQINI